MHTHQIPIEASAPRATRSRKGRARKAAAIGGAVALCATFATRAPLAQAGPLPSSPWNVDTYDFGSSPGSYVFIFTNIYTLPIVDIPAQFRTGEFRVATDSCTAVVNPGARCKVQVVYSSQGDPVADELQLLFNDVTGKPVATPAVELFGGGATYVHTTRASGDYSTGVPAGKKGRITIPYLPSPATPPWSIVDLPPILEYPWSVVANSCTTVLSDAGCKLTIAFSPAKAGTYRTDLQMTFANTQTGANVPTQDVTLLGTAS